ncbi:MAG TPA: 1-acyl-sn-glycerol-3-phosphate acyltransferase [Gemmataceae bacterium]|nr:1-acyl-sn-glycerol-3-phosphate acyltransferase [Gemmataceae bacterium]
MARVLILEPRPAVAELLVRHLRASPAVEGADVVAFARGRRGRPLPPPDLPALLRQEGSDTVVFSPWAMKAAAPDLAEVEAAFLALVRAGVRRAVVLSSASVYGPNPHNPGLVSEGRLTLRHRHNPIAAGWLALEALARRHLARGAGAALTVLRPAALPLADDLSPLGALLHRRLAFPVLGHDPSVQLLAPDDLARAVCRALEAGATGVFNVAPDGVIPLRQALRLAGVRSLPLPYLLQRLLRAAAATLGLAAPPAALDYLRYNWTVSGAKIKTEAGLVLQRASATAIADAVPERASAPERHRSYDDFGLDEEYFAARGRDVARLLRRYWRLEHRGLENVPRRGAAVLVGVHRGFMPWDGVLTAHLVAEERGRVPRFLIHPGLVKFPFLHDFITKHGGAIACQENADHLLRRGDLLAIFPEGIHGAFALYRDAYRLGSFGRNDYVRMALRHRAPIIPFVTLGSAEAFPILAKVEGPVGRWWKRYAEWPFIPVTPPLPLPSKWHMQFLPPLDVGARYPPEAAEDEGVVRAVGAEVRGRIEETLTWMRRRRPSLFYGSIFDDGPAPSAAGWPAAGSEVSVREAG